MSNKVGVLLLHGVGIQKSGYSIPLQNDVKRLLEVDGYKTEQVEFQEVLYADIFDDQQQTRAQYLIDTSHSFQIITKFIRWLLVFVLSDAVSYRAQYKRVHTRISEDISKLQKRLPDSTPIIIVAHSMGVTAISDYIYDLQENKYLNLNLTNIGNLKSLITFGCNIPLFEMGHKETVCIKRPDSDSKEKEFYWLNYYSPFDVFGYKVKKYYTIRPSPDFSIEDKLVYAGGILTKWNILSHLGYWSNGEIHQAVKNSISKHL